MRLAMREGMVPGETLPERLAWLERIGVEAIELHAGSLTLPDAELRAIVGASPVGVAAIEGIPRLLSLDPAERAAAKEEIRRRLALAGEFGAAGVLVVPQFGRTPAAPDLSPLHTSADLERELLLAQLRDLAPAAQAAGTRLFLEPLNRYEAYLVNRVEQGAEIGRAVGPEVGVMADFFHMNIEEADIAAAIRAAGSELVYVHVVDSNRVQPGGGHLDFRPGFAALKAIGYDGALGIECRIAGPYDDAVRETAAFLRREWAAATSA
jgi:sugar phosphate isomerase/epimerase